MMSDEIFAVQEAKQESQFSAIAWDYAQSLMPMTLSTFVLLIGLC